jgi:hypothetical protein
MSDTMTKLERAQSDFDDAVAARTDAERALQSHHGRVAVAKDRLDEAKRKAAAEIPVDRSARQLSGGGPVTEDHREINPATGQQKAYVVLSEAERGRGYVRPFRDAYRHLKCGAITTMSRDIAATYARDPHFYSGTFCTTCRGHFPVGEDGEFTWYEMDGSEGPKVGT